MKSGWVLAAGLLLASVSSAQTEWDLNRCIAVARSRSPLLRTARNMAQSTEFSISEVNATGLPQVTLAASSLYSPWNNRFGYDPALSDGGQYAAQVVVRQSLYDGGVRSLRLDQLHLESTERAKEYAKAERDVVFAVRQAYIEALRVRDAAMIERESVEQLSEYCDLVRRLAGGGSANATDVLKTELQLSAARISSATATEAFSLSLITLAEAIGLGPDTTITVTGSLDSLLTGISDGTENPRSFLDVTLSEMEYQKSLYDVSLSRHETYPVLSLTGDAGALTSGDNLRLPAAERSPWLGFSVGVTLEIPLITWGASGAHEQQKVVESENLRLESETVRRSVSAEVRKVRLQLRNAVARRDAAASMFRSATDNFLLTRSRYASGNVLSIEVLSAWQLLADTRRSELQARADIQTYRARLDQLCTE